MGLEFTLANQGKQNLQQKIVEKVKILTNLTIYIISHFYMDVE